MKKNENNNSNILNSQKKKPIPNIKNSNAKQIQLPLNKKLDIIEESTENQKKDINNINKKKNIKRNRWRNIIDEEIDITK